jgi:enamine deaminase RidA (YjgF/YER057c/UK114 family)
MNAERVNPAELGRPSGFSHAVSVTASRMVFLAGQVGTGRDGKVVSGGVVAQFGQALANLVIALGAAGGHPGDLVSLTIYVVDLDDYQAHGKQIGAVWRRLAGTEYPAMAAVGVTRLWDPEALVEIQGIAAASGLGIACRSCVPGRIVSLSLRPWLSWRRLPSRWHWPQPAQARPKPRNRRPPASSGRSGC